MNLLRLLVFIAASALLSACKHARAPVASSDTEATCPDRDGPLVPFTMQIPEDRFASECGQKLFSEPRTAWGYMTASGCVAIPPQFESAAPFIDGRAVVGVGEALETSNQWGVLVRYGAIDHAGAFAVAPEYLALSSFSDGVATGIVSETLPGEVFPKNIGYFVSDDGVRLGDAGCGIQVNVNLGDCDKISEGLRFTRPKRSLAEWATLLSPDRYAKLEEAVAPMMSFIGEDGEVASNETPGIYLNAQGEQAFEGWFDAACEFSEGLACVRPFDSELVGFIDKDGQFVIEPQFEDAGSFSNGLARVQHNDRTMFIRPDGSIAFETEAYVDWAADDGFIAFSQSVDGETRKGFLNFQGEEVIAPAYSRVGAVSEGFIAVQEDTFLNIPRWRFINTRGETPAGFEEARFVSYAPPRFINGLAKVEVIRFSETGTHYEWVDGVRTQLPGEQLNLHGYINTSGEWVLEPTTDWPTVNGMLYTGAGFCED